jgi:tetratricopeptide (TPR) repeat protein
VLLYELLTGTVPYEVPPAGIEALHEQITSGQPEPPSRVVTRSSGPAKRHLLGHGGTLHAELDSIVLKAIHPDRDQRYDSVEALRRDLQRFLDGRAVPTYSSSRWYHLRKFVSRNTISVVSGTVVALALIVGITVSNVATVRANRARLRAEQAERNATATVEYLQKLLSSVDPTVDGRRVRVVDLLLKASEIVGEDLKHQPEIEASVRKTIGWTLLELGLYDDARSELQTAYGIQQELLGASHPDTLVTLNALGRLAYKQGDYRDATDIHRRVLAEQRDQLGPEAPTTLWTTYNLAKALDKLGEWDEAEELYGATLAARTRTLGAAHPHTLVAMNSLGLLLAHRGKLSEAEELLRSTLALLEDHYDSQHPLTMNCGANLVVVLNQSGSFDAARTLAEPVLEAQRAVYGPDHPETLKTASELAVALGKAGQLDAALETAQDTVTLQTEALGANHPSTIATTLRLAELHCTAGKRDMALEAFRSGIEAASEALNGEHWQMAAYESMYAHCLLDSGYEDRARSLLEHALTELAGSGRWAEQRTRTTLARLSSATP